MVQASDGNGGTDSITVNVTIDSVNDTPVANPTTVTATNRTEGETAGTLVRSSTQVQSYFTDSDGDTLTYSITNGNGAGVFAIDTDTGSVTLAITLAQTQVGTYTLGVTATDGTASATTQLSIEVLNINDAPTINQGASTAVTMSEDGNPTAFSAPTITATDIDGDTLTWSLLTPAINGTATTSGTGSSPTLNYTPTTDFNGTDSFVVQASDGNGGTDSITVNVTIDSVNDEPRFTSTPITQATANSAYNYTPSATDIDSDSLSFSVANGSGLPSWLTLALLVEITEITGSNNPFNGINVGRGLNPAFVDIDNDGDMDAFIGEESGNINFYQNTGNNSSPIFTEIIGTNNPFDGVGIGYSSAPAFMDIDNDGDMDAFIGEGNGGISFYQNTGNNATPTFTQVTGSNNPFNGVNLGSRTTPAFVDIDNDGDSDAFIGEAGGNINFYQNTGNNTSPTFTETIGTNNPFNGVDVGGNSIPTFVDIDNDGDLDAFIGDINGNTNFYQNTGNNATPTFTQITGSNNPLNGIDVGLRSAPDFVDIDNDGDFDVFIGKDAGFDSDINFYQNNGNTQLTGVPSCSDLGNSSIVLNVNDGTNNATQSFSIAVNNDGTCIAPSNIRLNNATSIAINENIATNTTIGSLSATDSDTPAASLTFSLSGSGNDNAQFTITGTNTLAINISPDFETTPSYTIEVSVNDGVNTGTQTLIININNVNDAPQGLPSITGTPTKNQTLSVNTSAITDADGTNTFSFQWAASGTNISGAINATLLLTQAQVGSTIAVTVSYTDGQGFSELIISAPTTAVANAANNNPTASIVESDTTVTIGQSTTFTSNSTDSDGSITATTWLINNDVGGLDTVSTATSYVAPSGNGAEEFPVGTHTITLRVTDNDGATATTTVMLTVNTAPNQTPTASNTTLNINLLPQNQTTQTGTLNATDADGDTLTFSISEPLPARGSVLINNTNTGSYTYSTNPDVTTTGNDSFEFSVTDGESTVTADVSVILNTDPLYQYQWHLANTGQTTFATNAGTTGQDIGASGAISSGLTGAGVIVAVVDEGLEIAHEDLVANVVVGGSHDFSNGDNDPTNPTTTGDHGTSVAGLIASRGWNNVGGRGVAPFASLKGFNLIRESSFQTDDNFVDSLGAATYSADVAIFNQSYGTANTGDFLVSTAIETRYLTSVTNLRSGKGAVFVKAAGNGFTDYVSSASHCANARLNQVSCQNSNMDAANTLPYNIVVGALNANGTRTSYSTAGSSLWVSAPAGEYGTTNPAMLTTDQTGCNQGYSRSNDFDDNTNGLNSGCNYTSGFNGTSSAAPVTSGVIALVLEANPNLTWRDVKHILATTSDQVNSTLSTTTITINGVSYDAEPAWLTNAAGHKFHNYYGFGRVNASSAAAAARAYTLDSLGTFTTTVWIASGTINQPIPNNSTTGTTNAITTNSGLTVEAIQIRVNATHANISELAIELTSPSGTRSVLLNIFNGFESSNLNMVLESNAFYGETANGDWTIKVIDGLASNSSGTLNSWDIRIFGH